MVAGRWVINPAFLELGKLADRKVPNVRGKGTEANQVRMALTIINSLHWREETLIYPEASHFEEADWDKKQTKILAEIVSDNVSTEWIKKNIRTTTFPYLPWGGNPASIMEAAKDYLQYGIDGIKLTIISDDSDNDLVDHVETGFRYPIYGFIKLSMPQSINRENVMVLL